MSVAEGTAKHPSEYETARLPNTAKRFLAVCEGGNCRSTALAMMLKATLQYDALACSWKDISPETFAMLCEWADAIFVMEEYMAEKIPKEHNRKLNVVDVGVDVWSNPFHPELMGKISALLGSKPILQRERV